MKNFVNNLFYFVAIIALGYLIFSKKYNYLIKSIVVFLFTVMVLGFPYQSYIKKEIKESIDLLQKKVEQLGNVEASKDGVKFSFVIPAATTNQPGPTLDSPPIEFNPNKEGIVFTPKTNVIHNGNFEIPISNEFSAWGHGLYSDKIRALYPNIQLFWINFLNADIDVSVEKTELGNALKIVHKSETMDNRIGIMEQRLQVTPGKYRLSFWAKELDDFKGSALWFVTTDNWVIKENGVQRGCDLKEKGPFGWRYFFEEIQVDRDGDITFSIVSVGRGTVYITDISFIKQ